MNSTEMPEALAKLIANHEMAMASIPKPPAEPGPVQNRSEWLGEVDAARRRLDDQVRADLLGTEMPAPAVELRGHDMRIPVDQTTVKARVYEAPSSGPHPAVVYLHGGGWWMGGGDLAFRLADETCDRLARSGVVVLNVDYRLAPENPYPAAINDCLAAVEWLTQNAEPLNIDPTRIAVMGVSSGANIAAGASIRARATDSIRIRAQVLILPVIDRCCPTESLKEDHDAYEWSRIVWKLYLGDLVDDPPQDAALIHNEAIQDTPTTIIVTGDFDHLRDEGRAYAALLSKMGVQVVDLRYPRTHTTSTSETTERMNNEVHEAVVDVLTNAN